MTIQLMPHEVKPGDIISWSPEAIAHLEANVLSPGMGADYADPYEIVDTQVSEMWPDDDGKYILWMSSCPGDAYFFPGQDDPNYQKMTLIKHN